MNKLNALIAFPFIFVSAAFAGNAEICREIKDTPGIYLFVNGEGIVSLPTNEAQTYTADSYLFVVPKRQSRNAEAVMHLRMSTKAIEEGRNNYKKTKLSRNQIRSACAQKQDSGREDWADDGHDGTADIGFENYDNFANDQKRNHPRLQKWHFYWNAKNVRGRACRYTGNYVEPFETLYGKRDSAAVAATRGDAAFADPAKVKKNRKFASADATSVLVHRPIYRPNEANVCHAVRMPKTKGGFFSSSWTPKETTIEIWHFGREKPLKPDKIYRIRWKR